MVKCKKQNGNGILSMNFLNQDLFHLDECLLTHGLLLGIIVLFISETVRISYIYIHLLQQTATQVLQKGISKIDYYTKCAQSIMLNLIHELGSI